MVCNYSSNHKADMLELLLLLLSLLLFVLLLALFLFFWGGGNGGGGVHCFLILYKTNFSDGFREHKSKC